ncbi:helix-turn-helix domain-containing protein [Caldimonas mangrovi]
MWSSDGKPQRCRSGGRPAPPAGGNQSEAARRLGVSCVSLIKKLGRLGLK